MLLPSFSWTRSHLRSWASKKDHLYKKKKLHVPASIKYYLRQQAIKSRMRVSTGSRDTKLHSGNLLVMTKCILSLCLMRGCKPRSESKINPWALTCWQEFDVSAHSFALRFTPIASVPATKASVLFWLSCRKKRKEKPLLSILWHLSGKERRQISAFAFH